MNEFVAKNQQGWRKVWKSGWAISNAARTRCPAEPSLTNDQQIRLQPSLSWFVHSTAGLKEKVHLCICEDDLTVAIWWNLASQDSYLQNWLPGSCKKDKLWQLDNSKTVSTNHALWYDVDLPTIHKFPCSKNGFWNLSQFSHCCNYLEIVGKFWNMNEPRPQYLEIVGKFWNMDEPICYWFLMMILHLRLQQFVWYI